MTKKTLNELREHFTTVVTIEIETLRRAELKENEEERKSAVEFWLPRVQSNIAAMILLASGCNIITDKEFYFMNSHIRHADTAKELMLIVSIIEV